MTDALLKNLHTQKSKIRALYEETLMLLFCQHSPYFVTRVLHSFQHCYFLKGTNCSFTFAALISAGNIVEVSWGSSLPLNSPSSRHYHHILTSFLHRTPLRPLPKHTHDYSPQLRIPPPWTPSSGISLSQVLSATYDLYGIAFSGFGITTVKITFIAIGLEIFKNKNKQKKNYMSPFTTIKRSLYIFISIYLYIYISGFTAGLQLPSLVSSVYLK